MVKRNFLNRAIEDESGVTMIEALLSIPLVMIAIAGMIEVGVMMFQFSQTAKAMQVGARLAAVSSPAASDMSALTADYPADSDGAPVPTTPVTVVCGADATPCESAALSRIYDGGDCFCGTPSENNPYSPRAGCTPVGSETNLVGICEVAPFIDEDNIRISYYRSGLGFVGRPKGPVVTVRVEVRNVQFDMLILDDLINYFLPSSSFGSFSIPAQPVAMTSEDLSSCRGTC